MSKKKENTNLFWSQLQLAGEEKKNQATMSDASGNELTVLVAGGKQSGKSTLVSKFLNRQETPAPTVALEYTYGRRSRATGNIKDITHIFELAGGDSLLDLMEISINESNLHTSVFVLVVNLMDAGDIMKLSERILTRLSNHLQTVCDGLEKRGSKRPKALKAQAQKRFNEEHPDLNSIQLLTIPTIVVATHYDQFMKTELEKQKWTSRALRFLCHTRGASLIYTSHTDEPSINRFRALLSHYAFKMNAPKTVQMDHTKPICIMAGNDTLSQIGVPSNVVPPVQWSHWQSELSRLYTENVIKDKIEDIDISKYPESVIDVLYKEKEEELAKLRRDRAKVSEPQKA